MASASIVSRFLGKAFDRSRRLPSRVRGFASYTEGFQATEGDEPGTVHIEFTLGRTAHSMNADKQAKHIAQTFAQYTEHLSERWNVQPHPTLNRLVVSDRAEDAPSTDEAKTMTYDEVQPDTRVICHSRGGIKGTVLHKFMGGTDNAEELVYIDFDECGPAYNSPDQLSPLDEPAPAPKLSRAYRGRSSFWLGGHEYEIFNQAVLGQDVRGFWACVRKSHDGKFLGNEAYIVTRSESRLTAFAEALAALRP